MFTYENFATFAVELEKRTLGHSEKRRIGDLSTWRNRDKWTRRIGETDKRILGEMDTWRIGDLETRILGETEKSGHGETDTWRIGDITGGTRYMFNKNRNIYDLRRRAGIEFPQSTWT